MNDRIFYTLFYVGLTAKKKCEELNDQLFNKEENSEECIGIFQDKDVFVVFDNLTNEFSVEDFEDRMQAMTWLYEC